MDAYPLIAGDAASATRARSDQHAMQLGQVVVESLIDEVTLTPKPGLVDMRSRGAHDDLDWSLMCASACALLPTFCDLAWAGMHVYDALTLRECIGALGRDGEAAMFEATRGVNTHRGAIWALGLLVTAAAQNLGDRSPRGIAMRAGILACVPDRHAPAQSGNKGEVACRSYGVGGARGQAQAGFPHVVDIALPELWHSRSRGEGETAARLNALLAVMASLDDTCVLSRGGRDALSVVQAGAGRVLHHGGAAAPLGRSHLKRLDRALIELRVSPGGAADLLAAALFLDRLVTEESRFSA